MQGSQTLTGHELFQSLRFEDVDRINSFSGTKELRKDEVVFESGAVGSHVYVVLEGRISLRMPARANEACLAIGLIEKGEMFGLAPLLGAGRHVVRAQCVEPSHLLAIESAPLRELLENEPRIGFHVMKLAAQTYFSRYVASLERVQAVINDLAVV